MEHHVGIDVSLELSSLCVLDATGKVVREAKVASEPGALVAFLGRVPGDGVGATGRCWAGVSRGQAATAGRLTAGASLMGASVSRLM